MKIGVFHLDEPLPELQEPHAIVVLSPWIDVCDVGSLTLKMLMTYLHANPLGDLAKPSKYFDFTRYRPVMRFVKGEREVEIPNSYIHYARGQKENDFLFLHLLEPHANGEEYTESIMKVLRAFDVKRYLLIGSMYDAVPHTRPLIVSGTATGSMQPVMHKLSVQPSNYEGPTSITYMVSHEAPRYGIDVASMIVHLPQYVKLEKDYAGVLRLSELLCTMYGMPSELKELRQLVRKQDEEITEAIDSEPQLKQIVQQLEDYYEAIVRGDKEPELSPEIEDFIRKATEHFESS